MTTRTHKTDTDYAALAADYEAHPPTADEIISIEVDPAVLRTGRPAKSADSRGKTPVLAIRLPEDIRTKLETLGRVEGAKVSELVRRAVIEYLQQHTASPLHQAPKETAMSKNNDNVRYVVSNPDGGWDVKKDHAGHASNHFDRQADAERRAKEIVRNAGGGQVQIQGRNGKWRDGDTVKPGNDPLPPRDKKH